MCKDCLDPYNSRERKLQKYPVLIFLINMCKDLTKVLQLQGFNQIYIGKENYILNHWFPKNKIQLKNCGFFFFHIILQPKIEKFSHHLSKNRSKTIIILWNFYLLQDMLSSSSSISSNVYLDEVRTRIRSDHSIAARASLSWTSKT